MCHYTKKNKIAVVGIGLVGVRHVQALQSAKNAELVAIVDVRGDIQQIAQQYNVPAFYKTKKMLSIIKPDGVIIATPNDLHMLGACVCIEHQVPVLVEKPLAPTIEQCKHIIDTSEKYNIPVLTGYFRRYNPIVSTAKDCINNGVLGNIVSVHSHFWVHKQDAYFDVPWRTQKNGGPINTNLSHDIDLLHYFIGDITNVTAMGCNKNRNLDVLDTAVVICEFKNGVLGTLNISDTIPAPWSWELTAGDNVAYPNTQNTYCMIGGTNASLELPKNRIWYYKQDKNWFTPISTDTVNIPHIQDSLVTQIEHFSDVISGTATPKITARDGLKVMQVIEAISTSISTHKTIYI